MFILQQCREKEALRNLTNRQQINDVSPSSGVHGQRNAEQFVDGVAVDENWSHATNQTKH